MICFMAFQHINKRGNKYYLHSIDITLRGSGKNQTIYFFSKDIRKGSLDDLPRGYQVVESQKTGLPVLKKA